MSLESFILTAMVTPLKAHPKDEKCIWGLPVLIWGDPGIGKSDRIEWVSEFLNLLNDTLFPSTLSPEDVGGYPTQDGKGGLVRSCDDPDVKIIIEAGEGTIFFDEINLARQAVLAALLGVVLKRRFGGQKLPNRCRVMAAANPPESSAGGFELPLPLANRFCHKFIKTPTPREWIGWLMEHERTDLPTLYDAEKLICDGWDSVWAQMRGETAGFIGSVKGASMLHSVPLVGSLDRGRAWASPRTWDWLTRARTTAKILGMGGQVEQDLMDGCVGNGASTELNKWLADANLPKPEDALNGLWNPDKAHLDVSMAVYEGVAAYVAALPENEEKEKIATKAWVLLNKACKVGHADLIFEPARVLTNKGFGVSRPNAEAMRKEAEPVLKRIYPLNNIADAAEKLVKGVK